MNLNDALYAVKVAEDEEWRHGQRCHSIDCAACLQLMTASNAAHARLSAAFVAEAARLAQAAERQTVGAR